MKSLRATIFGLALAVLSACAGAYVATDAGAHQQKLQLNPAGQGSP